MNTKLGQHALRLGKALCIFLLIGLLAAPACGQQDIEQRKIEYLISAVADLHDARFIRNGSEYDAQTAADHLHLKLHYAGGRVKTVDDFIVYCATGSSMTGQAYQIKFADGSTVALAAFMRGSLAAYAPESGQQSIRQAEPGE